MPSWRCCSIILAVPRSRWVDEPIFGSSGCSLTTTGAGQAIEDALILETVLGAVKSRQDVAHAFSVYEKIRLPRRSSIADSSRESAILFTGRSDTGLNTEEVRKKLVGWGSNIVDYDIEAAQVEALQLVSRH